MASGGPARQVYAEGVVEYHAEVLRPARGHRRGAQGELQDEIPADDPRHQLSEAGVGERVGRARDRHGRCELGVAQGGQGARDARGHEGQADRRPGQGARGLAGQHEDAGADDHADPQDGQVQRTQGTSQTVLRLLGVGDRLLHRLGAQRVHGLLLPSCKRLTRCACRPRCRGTAGTRCSGRADRTHAPPRRGG